MTRSSIQRRAIEFPVLLSVEGPLHMRALLRAAALVVCLCGPVTSAAPAHLAGRVQAMGTRELLVGATVSVADGGVVETDVEGRFELELTPGARPVTVRAVGFTPAEFVEHLTAGQRVEVVYRLERSTWEPYETVVRARRDSDSPRMELSRVELTEVAGTQGDPFRVVMLLPGVASVASGLSYPVVRGTQPAATGFVIDGVRVPQLYHLLAGPAVVHPELIERVDFFSGAVPARFGRLLGGVIDGKVSRPSPKLHVSASVDLLSAGAFAAVPIERANLHVTVGGRVSYTALIASQVAKAVFPPSSGALVANFQDYQARLEWNPGPGTLRLFALGSADEAGTRATPQGGSTAILSSVFHRVDLAWRMPLYGGRFEAGGTWGTERLGLYGESEGREFGRFASDRDVLQARARWSRELTSAWNLDLGADVDRQRVSLAIDRDPVVAQGAASSFRQANTIGTMAGVYGDASWSSEPWSATLGLRGDLFFLAGGPTRWALEPRLTLRRTLTPSIGLRAAAGLAHQAPTVMINVPISDVAGLRDGLQQGARFELGADVKLPASFEGAASLFYNPLFRAIEYSLGDLFNNRARIDQGPTAGIPGRAYGLELLVRKRPEGRWFGWVSYTLMRSERLRTVIDFDGQGNVVGASPRWVAFDFDQTHVLSVTGGVQLPRGFKVSAGVHANSGRPEFGALTSRALQPGVDPVTLARAWVPVSLAREPRLPPFLRLDVRGSKTWTFDDFVLELYLDVLNASVSQEVLGYTYSAQPFERQPFVVPAILPTLGVKGTY